MSEYFCKECGECFDRCACEYGSSLDDRIKEARREVAVARHNTRLTRFNLELIFVAMAIALGALATYLQSMHP